MKRPGIIIFLLIATTCCWPFISSFGQYYYYNNNYYDNDLVFEIGGGIGAINSITDIGGQQKLAKKRYFNEINIQTFNLSQNFYLAAVYKNVVAARLELTIGTVRGYDSLLVRGTPRFDRNLSFKSPITELALLVEFHPLMLKYYEEGTPTFSPYVVAGVGWFNFNPQGNLNGRWINLQPLSLEGQGFTEFPDRKPYKLSQPNLSIGAGIKYEATDNISFRLEWVHRYLFTDYLDDVSLTYINPALFDKYFSPAEAALAKQLYLRGKRNNRNRGERKNTDTYFSINFKVGFTFGRSRR